jgi:alkylation response protein AidB-like acyl-CoA dehydrogenase
VNLELSETSQTLQATWKSFVAEHLTPLAESIETAGALPAEALRMFADHQVLTPFLPAHLGGKDASLLDLTLLLEECSKVSPAVALLFAQQVIIGIRTNIRAFQFADREPLAKAAARCATIFSLAATEQDSGSDLTNLATTCHRAGDSLLIAGGKAFVNWANRAGYILTLARATDVEGDRATTLVAIPRQTPGLAIGQAHPTLGMLGLEAAPVTLGECLIPESSIIGVHGFGFDLYDQLVNEMRIALSAIGTGICQQVFDEAVVHGKGRKQFGKPVGSFQSLQWRFADAATRLDAARLHTWRAVEMAGQKGSCFLHAAMAKVYAAEAACENADFALQVLGSRGYIKPSRVERLFRDARFLKLAHGTCEILRNRIGEYL